MVVDSDIVAGGLTVFLLICFRPKKGEDSMMPFSETIVGGRKTKKLSIVINLMAFQRQWRSRVSAFSRNDWNLWSFGFRYVAMKKYPLLNQKVHLQSWSVFQPAILALPELFTLSDPCLMPGKYRRVNDGKNSKYRPPLYESMEKKNTTFGEDLVSGTPTPAIVQTGRQSQKWSTGGLLDTSTVMNPWYYILAGRVAYGWTQKKVCTSWRWVTYISALTWNRGDSC